MLYASSTHCANRYACKSEQGTLHSTKKHGLSTFCALATASGKRQAARSLPNTSFLQHSTSRLSASDAGDRDHSLKVLQYDSVGVSETAAERPYDGQIPVRNYVLSNTCTVLNASTGFSYMPAPYKKESSTLTNI